ncbi:MAG: hypothetical protein ABR543_12605 [Gemmatimonadaceae bacterium]
MPATSREHVPPKSFFTKADNVQLKAAPSCDEQNSKKSGDDQYLLTQVTINAAAGDNPVDIDRFDRFFDNLTAAVFYDDFGVPINQDTHLLRHPSSLPGLNVFGPRRACAHRTSEGGVHLSHIELRTSIRVIRC